MEVKSLVELTQVQVKKIQVNLVSVDSGFVKLSRIAHV